MKKWKKYLIVTLLLLSTLVGCSAPLFKQADREQQAFNLYLDDLFVALASKDTLSLNYTLSEPEAFGVHMDAASLGDFSLQSMQASTKKEQEHYKKLLKFHPKRLNTEQQLIYKLLKKNFELDLKYKDYSLYTEILGPTTGIQAQLPILLAEYKFYSRSDIDNYLSILVDTARYFNQICEFERLKSKAGLFMSDEVALQIIDQCRAFIDNPDKNYLIEYFNNKIIHFSNLSPTEKKSYIKKNESNVKTYVIPAYESLIQTLQECMGTGTNPNGLANFSHGKDYYSYLVASYTGSDKSIEEMSQMLEHALETSLGTMSKVLKDDPNILKKINSYSYCKTEPTEILDYLKTSIADHYPDVPAVNCSIKEVHRSLQDHVSPAMYLIPPIDRYESNCIYINKNPKYDLTDLFTTIAHEGYPGHLYQCVYFRSQNPHPIRSMINFTGYDEGWATYAELSSYDYSGLDPNVALILKSNMIATHCIYSRADIGIHYENWDYNKTKEYLSQFVSESSCKAIYRTLLEEPAIYLPYSIGYLEFADLKTTAMQMLGSRFDEKQFHTFLLNIGPCDFGTLRDAMIDWINSIV